MLPVIAIVGRPNVGKSTLFNALTGTRDALVADAPGLTRDRQYGIGTVHNRRYLVVDTGGFSHEDSELTRLITDQTTSAVEEADVTLFMVDARSGLTAHDEIIAKRLRRSARPIVLVVNKTEGLEPSIAASEFHALGLGPPWPVSAAHKRGLDALMAAVAQILPDAEVETEQPTERRVKVAIIGRPNVGKSTLVNRLLGNDRVLAHDMPGTTRDSVYAPFEHKNKHYTLIDTAGIRRRAKVQQKIEKISVIKSLQAIEAANVVITLLDAGEGITDQDLTLIGLVLNSGRAIVVAINKWDSIDEVRRSRVHYNLERKLRFLDFARRHSISAHFGTGLGGLFRSVDQAWQSASRDLATSKLTRILLDAVAEHPPPLVKVGRRVKLRYAHQGGQNPPLIVVHGNNTGALRDSYQRYLLRTFRTALGLEGTPVRIEFKSGVNPYEGRRNVLTRRQHKKRARLVKHSRRTK